MEFKAFLVVFGSVFLAELGDKTQLATMMFASQENVSKWMVFLASSLALVLSSALGTIFGSALGQWLSPKTIQIIAGVVFLILGAGLLWEALNYAPRS